MCGIAGIISPGVERYKSNLDSMVKSLHHRGPDSNGLFYYPDCALGHTRLKIIDLETGAQPMFSPNKEDAIVFNGEIYGYQKIREELLTFYHWQTKSDTEVILALYEKYGTKMIDKLPGMFSFALWDNRKKMLLCARDRFGEKPFYYAWGKNGEFIFASEIKAIIASKLVEPILDKQSIFHYLKRLYVHPQKTIYKNIFILPPAHNLIYHSGNLKIEKYWQLPVILEKIELNEALEKFKILFSGAVKSCLVADVPIGIFLSGGLDSSSIVAIASEFNKDLTTLTFGFNDKSNELPYGRAVAKQYQTKHFELREENYNISELILKMQEVYDEPFADSSNIPTYLLARLASRKIKVALGGDGGDELLAGYDYWYNDLYYLEKIKNNGFYKNLFFRYLVKILQLLNYPVAGNLKRPGRIYDLKEKYKNIPEAHFNQNIYFTNKEINNLIPDFPIQEIVNLDFKQNNNLDTVFRMDVSDYLPGDILVKIDRASMANGLELRSPFLDMQFASFCLSLPYNLKISDNENKVILRRAYEDKWPASIKRRNKQGFGAPVEKWLKNKNVIQLKKDFLENDKNKIYQILSFKKCQPYLEKDDYKTWILLILSIWMEGHKFNFVY